LLILLASLSFATGTGVAASVAASHCERALR
jgi:hypothetical protein